MMRNITISLVVLLLVIALPLLGSFSSQTSSSGSGGGTWGSITGTLSAQSDLQTELNARVADTGNETVAGVKTFSSAPICSALTAQAMPYLDASKQLADGKWTQADTTGATTFAPSGTPATSLTINGAGLSGAWTNVVKATATYPTSGNVYPVRLDMTNSASGATQNFGISSYVSDAATSTTTNIAGFRADIDASNTGASMACSIGPCSGTYGFQSVVRNQNTTGVAVSTYGTAYGTKNMVGGLFVAEQSVTSGKSVGVEGFASKENSAQATGVWGRIVPTSTAALTSALPSFNAAGLFDNTTTTNDIVVAADNGTSVFHVRDGGTVVLGQGSTTTAIHEINGAVEASGGGTGALTGFPTTAAPAVYLKLRVNGTVYFFPGWALP